MKTKLLVFLLSVMLVFTMMPQLGALAYADDSVSLPEGAPFEAVALDSGSPISVEEMEEQVESSYNGSAPLYLITVPEGATTALIQFQKSSVFCDTDYSTGELAAFGYEYEELVQSNPMGISLPVEVNGDIATISLNIEDYLYEDGKAVGPENTQFAPVCGFTFAYGEAQGDDPVPVEAPFTIGGVETYDITAGEALALDDTKPHYVIHLTEEAVNNKSWTINVNEDVKSQIYWADASKGWAAGAMMVVFNSPQEVRSGNANAVFAALSIGIPQNPQQYMRWASQNLGTMKNSVLYYYTVVADLEEPAHEHVWGEADYAWADDGSKCTASRACTLNPNHTETEDAAITSAETKAATCDTKGEHTYTATFENPAFETKTKVIADIPALNHQWGGWTKIDNAQHQRVCGRNNEHVEKANHTWDGGKETTPATTEAEGVMTYTCTACKAERTEPIPMLQGVIKISNAAELKDFADNAPADAEAVLTADIDLADLAEGETWTPKSSFSGSFNGQNHTIKNLTGPLFTKVAGTSSSNRAEVKNVTVEGDIAGSGNVGGVAGQAYFAAFYGCINKATITSGTKVGGIVGLAQQSMGVGSVSFTNCGNEGDLTGTSNNYTCVGGIFGYGQSEINLESCYNKGAIAGFGGTDSSAGTGGIGGYVQGYKTSCSMNNLYNNGAVSGKQAVGGLLGSMRNGVSITNGYNSGAITGTSKAGAIAGSAYNATSKATNCYYLDTSCAQAAQGNNPGGVTGGSAAKTDEELKADAMIGLLGGAFKATDEYPILVWEAYSAGAKIYEVTPPATSGISFSGAQSASSEEPYEFKITIDKYHKAADDFAVKINNETVEPASVSGTEYSFVVEEPSCDMVITAEGVADAGQAIWTGRDPAQSARAVVKINIYNVDIKNIDKDGNNVTVTLAEGTPLDKVIPFRLITEGTDLAPLEVKPGFSFDRKLAKGRLTQYIKATAQGDHSAEWNIVIEVAGRPEPETVNVNKPESDMFTIKGDDKAVKDEDYSFIVAVGSRYYKTSDYKVKVNGVELKEDEGEYTVENVQEALDITVEGVVMLTFDHIIACKPDCNHEGVSDKVIVDDHTKVLKGKYDVEMGVFASSETETYHGVPYYHVTVPYGTKKVKVAYPDYIYSSASGQEGANNGNCWTSNNVTIKNNVPQKGPGTNAGFTRFTRDADNNKVLELNVSDYHVNANGSGTGFSLIGKTGGGNPGFYGVITFEVAPCQHEAVHMISTDRVEAECEKPGTKEYWTCDLCKTMFSDQNGENEIAAPETIDALGHDYGKSEYTWADDKSTVTAERVCSRSEEHIDKETAEVKAEQTKDPTCTEKGETTYTATFKNEAFETQSQTLADIDALGHDWDNGKVTTEPKCKDAGVKVFTCKNDPSHTRTEAIDPAGHTWKTAKTVDKKATCTAKGEKSIHCEVCDAIDPATVEAIPALGHKWGAWKVTKKATATRNGEKQRVCKNDASHVEKQTIKKKKVSGTLVAQAKAKGKTSLEFTWNKVSGADGYDIFFSRCNHGKTNNICKLVKTIKGNKTFSWTINGLSKGTAYKAYVKAFTMNKGKKTYVKTSPSAHLYTGGYTKKYTNVKSLIVKKRNVTLKKGKIYKIKAKVTKLNKNKKHMPEGHGAKIRYISSNKKIATVSKTGNVKAKAKGVCKIYVIGINGMSKAVKVTVK